MNSKERVLMALNHEEPDRVPKDCWFTPEIEEELKVILGISSSEPYQLQVELGHDWLTIELGIDLGFLINQRPECKIPEAANLYKDEWGIIWKEISYGKGAYCEIYEHPIKDISEVDKYTAPDPMDPEIIKSAKRTINEYGSTHAIMGGVPCTIYEAAWYLRGKKELIYDFYDNPDFVEVLFDKVMEYHLIAGDRLIELGVDVIWAGDDVGNQSSMEISPELWRKLLKPRYAFMFEHWRKRNRNIKIAFHSDGYIEPIIDDFIEIGLDILNPVQPLSMNPAEIKKKYGRNLSFWGTVDVQYVMPLGSAKDVINEVRERINTMAPGGGFILCTAHAVQPSNRAIDNIFAYYWAAEKYGYYSKIR
ncbi:MAG: hypothetical protein M1371_03305 [Actinobacteria bacterium]|nr:hypothetical protein [Actinomycetota bacterium]